MTFDLLHENVRQAAERGWKLLPVTARCKKPPLIKAWPQRATSELVQLERWARTHQGCNWAVATGSQSGTWVLDIDGEWGRKSLVEFDRLGMSLPNALTVATPGGGAHLYFQYSSDFPVRCSVKRLAPGLDVRGDGGYALIPPSVHPNGGQYSYADPAGPLARPPAWLVEQLRTAGATKRGMPEKPFNLLEEGHRNDGLTRLAGALRRRGADQGELEMELLTANTRRCVPPLGHEEVLRIAASVARYPVGGPDPLELAWSECDFQNCGSPYERFLELARHLQSLRPNLPIALPLERISELFKCDWTQVRRWRNRAEASGILTLYSRPVPHRKAATFMFNEPSPRGVPLGRSEPH